MIRALGDWTLRMLCLVLAVTPLRVMTGTPGLARFRRMLGLFVFFYAALHLLAYAWFDMGLDGPRSCVMSSSGLSSWWGCSRAWC